ncbi:SWIM zinc finger family protein [Candidatus Poriferisodalis sp.]|uniref:SWIM zinc finger family protein n=1 Tax=Candidatus Poriferisodalis sp. TaxID=3101277 RepID=UPI003B02A123
MDQLFDAARVKRLAGPRSFERGVGYLHQRRIGTPVERDGRVRAMVRGTVPYIVELWADGDRPRWSCTCPAAEVGSFCKHCMATALALLPRRDEPDVRPGRASSESGPARRRIGTSASAPKLSVWVRRIDRAFFAHGEFVSYYEAEAWADGIHVMIESLENLCDTGHPDAVTELAEHVFGCADEAMNYVDDSDGHLTGIIDRLSELHLRSCREETADPVKLAARLVKLELSSELDGFHRAAANYVDVLGEAGLAEYWRQIEPRWRKIKPTDDPYGAAFTVRQAMIGWALATGNPDALIEVHSRGKPLPDDVLNIAGALKDAGRVDEAISWAKRCIAENRSRPRMTDDLRECLSCWLDERGENAAALDLFWQAFVAEPSVDRYRRLLDKAPGHDWLERCVGELRTKLARQPRPPADWPPTAHSSPPTLTQPPVPHDATALVEILLFEGQADGAWDAAAEFGCGPTLRLTLARVREQTHPLDAIAVYRAEALAIIGRKRPNHYRSAVDLMERIRRLADTADEPERFTLFLQHIRTEHKRKSRLIAEIDERGWPTSA